MNLYRVMFNDQYGRLRSYTVDAMPLAIAEEYLAKWKALYVGDGITPVDIPGAEPYVYPLTNPHIAPAR